MTCFYTDMTLCVIVLVLHWHFNSFLPHKVALQHDPLTHPTLYTYRNTLTRYKFLFYTLMTYIFKPYTHSTLVQTKLILKDVLILSCPEFMPKERLWNSHLSCYETPEHWAFKFWGGLYILTWYLKCHGTGCLQWVPCTKYCQITTSKYVNLGFHIVS